MGIIDIFSSALDAAVDVCRSIGGAIMDHAGEFIAELPAIIVPVVLGDVDPIVAVIKIVVLAAEYALSKPGGETPAELGLKAEVCEHETGLTSKDFDSTAEYIEYLREKIEIDQSTLDEMDVQEKQKYDLIGIALYNEDLAERFGMNLGAEFWRAIISTDCCRDGDEVAQLLSCLKDHGITDGRYLDAYFAGKLAPGCEERLAVHGAVRDYAQMQAAPIKINDLVTSYSEKVPQK